MSRASIAAIDAHLADEGSGGLWYGQVDMASGRRTATEFGALHAFLPGVLVLGGELERARRLEASCFRMWQLRGIEPELIDYRTLAIRDAGYPLRPEIIESAWYLRRATGDPQYLAMGKAFFDALVAHARAGDGFTVLTSVETMAQGDLMPSYFLAETRSISTMRCSPPRHTCCGGPGSAGRCTPQIAQEPHPELGDRAIGETAVLEAGDGDQWPWSSRSPRSPPSGPQEASPSHRSDREKTTFLVAK